MRNIEQLLPVGSVVYLNGATQHLVIIGVCKLVQVGDSSKLSYFDYSSTVYPGGLERDALFYFNHEDIEQVVFTGYDSEMFRQYLRVVHQKLLEEQGTFVIGQVQ